MHTETTAKVAALAAALLMNSLILAAAAHLFDGRPQQRPAMAALAHAPVPGRNGVAGAAMSPGTLPDAQRNGGERQYTDRA